jgi:hypothetical protein
VQAKEGLDVSDILDRNAFACPSVSSFAFL